MTFPFPNGDDYVAEVNGYGGMDSMGQQYSYWFAESLGALGETVIQEIKIDKILQYQVQSAPGVTGVDAVDPVPADPNGIPAWAEVIFPTTVEGYQQIQGIDYIGIVSTIGFQNLA